MTRYYAQDKFEQRRNLIARLTVDKTLPLFTEDGGWAGENFEIGMREIMWFANGFFQQGSRRAVKIANRIIQKNISGYRFCHFLPFVCLQSFYHYENQMEPETVGLMDEYVQTYIEEFMLPGLDFVGCNDNFPCMSTGAVLFAGQRYGKPAYIEKARERLKQLVGLLERRGFSSEYTSPTYTPIQALVLADIANYAEDEDIRDMAIYCEQRILADLLMHMFWPAAQCSGAFSRGYPVDAVGGTHHARFLYYMLYGEELPIGLEETLFAGDKEMEKFVTHHSWSFLRISAMWQAMPDYHCPIDLAQWAKHRQYPYICAGTSESISSMDAPFRFLPAPSAPLAEYYENPLRENFLYTYMTEDYALGSSRFAFHNGCQSHGLRLLYKKRPDIRKQEDVGEMFIRYVVNDADVDWASGEYFDMGNMVSQQRENSAMILYAPRLLHNEQISSLKLTANLVWTREDDMEIRVDGKSIDPNRYCTEQLSPLFIRDGDIYMMLQPLFPQNSGVGIEILRKERVIEISFVNYRGRERNFARSELLKFGNGLALEVRSRKQVKTFENFCRQMNPRVEDKWFNSLRQCRYENDGHSMAMEYSPLSQSVRYIIQDGLLPAQPRLLSSDFKKLYQ